MSDARIRTNRHWRHFADSCEVPASVLAGEFDYLDDPSGATFFQYHGTWYELGQFMRGGVEGWQGSHSDSAFSGVLINVSSDGKSYQVARFSC